jgi:SPX domain protein involved in polyphosphate accumulation
MEVWNRNITFKFATVQEYFDEVKALDIKFPFFHGDFMPYIQYESGTFDHWVGYYSSTPTLKKMIRDMFSHLRALKMQIFTVLSKELSQGFKNILSQLPNVIQQLRTLDEQAGILLHHDAITSTSPQNTLNDYMRRVREVESFITGFQGK